MAAHALIVLLSIMATMPVVSSTNLAICGATYNEALGRCRGDSFKCPTGDGCPIGQNCYNIPPASCAAVPTIAATSSLSICGLDYNDAASNCKMNVACPTGDGCPIGMACFNVPSDICDALLEEEGVVEGGAQEVDATFDATVAMATINEAPHQIAYKTETEVNGIGLPSSGSFKVCGSTYSVALSQCRTGQMCPTGDGCPMGQTCYDIPNDTCSETLAAAMAAAAAPSSLMVCGLDYNDAASNCNSNVGCPTGDGCPSEMACFDIPTNICNAAAEAQAGIIETNEEEDSPTDPPKLDHQLDNLMNTGVTAEEEIGNLKVCAQSYDYALSYCPMNPTCPSGDGCPVGQNCYDLPIKTCPEAMVATALTSLMICGLDYNDAASNCKTNLGCPTGDGCPNEMACFTIPSDICHAAEADVEVEAEADVLEALEDTVAVVTTVPNETTETTTTDATVESTTTIATDPAVIAAKQDVTSKLTPHEATPPAPENLLYVCGEGYPDAAANCHTNTACPTGDGCPDGTTCFVLPPSVCPELVSNDASVAAASAEAAVSTVEAVATVDVTPSSTSEPTTASPTTPPTPAQMYVCGSDYPDASQNFCVNARCLSGAGCPNDGLCFALPYAECTPNLDAATSALSVNADFVQQSESQSESSTTPPTITAAPVTPTPTKSPVHNTFFCGETYQLAEANCWTAEPCPSGTGCTKPNESCYGISTEKCFSNEPTLSPTTDMPSASPTPKPTNSPVVNTFFCGSTYSEAESGCGEATACPLGECAAGLTCYSGIQCSAPVSATNIEDLTLTLMDEADKLMAGLSGGSGNESEVTTPEAPLDVTTPGSPLDISTTESSPPEDPYKAPSYIHYTAFCGVDYNDASSNCFLNTPCPFLNSEHCPDGQECYPVGRCEAPVDTSATTLAGTDITQTESSSPEIDENSVPSYIHYTSFCGVDYNDASSNCFTNTPCPFLNSDECPDGQECYPIGRCEVASAISVNVGDISMSTDSSAPTQQPTPPPTWNWNYVMMKENGAAGLNDVMMKSLALGSVILTAFLF